MILSLETSTKVCSLAVHDQGTLLGNASYHLDKSHSALLPLVIGELLGNLDLSKQDLTAVAISEGPGSYTGLRIGASIAKGLSFSLELPLISINTLTIIAEPFIDIAGENDLLIPMLDARRMEVYTLALDTDRVIQMETRPLIIEGNSFLSFENKKLWLMGNGAEKCRDVLEHPEFKIIEDQFPDAKNMGKIAFEKFAQKDFVDVAYFEPNYLKPFQTKKAKNRLLQ